MRNLSQLCNANDSETTENNRYPSSVDVIPAGCGERCAEELVTYCGIPRHFSPLREENKYTIGVEGCASPEGLGKTRHHTTHTQQEKIVGLSMDRRTSGCLLWLWSPTQPVTLKKRTTNCKSRTSMIGGSRVRRLRCLVCVPRTRWKAAKFPFSRFADLRTFTPCNR